MFAVDALTAQKTKDGISLEVSGILPTPAYEVKFRRQFGPGDSGRVATIYLRAEPTGAIAKTMPTTFEKTIEIEGNFTKTVIIKIKGKPSKRVSIQPF